MYKSLRDFASFLYSTKQSDIIVKTLIVLSTIVAYRIIVQKRMFDTRSVGEGFEQSAPFVLKQNSQCYDGFYVDVYDYLFQTDARAEQDIIAIETTQPDKKNSIILDVGCGSGALVNIMTEKGYENVYGIDVSESMIQRSRNIHPHAKTKIGDALNPLEFEPHTFTHITCTNFTVYTIHDKARFFKNCATWLVPHGYLVIHLVTPDKFDPIVPSGNPHMIDSPQKYSTRGRIHGTHIDFDDFTYKSAYDFKHANKHRVTHTETFTDSHTRHIRQNEHDLVMEPIANIIDIARMCGFDAIGHFNNDSFTRDEHQYIYVFERI